MFKIFSVLLLIQMKMTHWCLSQDVIRGKQDRFRSEIWPNVNGSTCSDDGYCKCVGSGGYNTFIYDNDDDDDDDDSSSGRCVKSEHIIEDTSAAKYIKDGSRGCIGLSTKLTKTTIVPCGAIDDISSRWLWTKNGFLVNLKTLKCLTYNGDLFLEQCDGKALNNGQRWKCNTQFLPGRIFYYSIRNERDGRRTRNWIHKNLGSKYITSCTKGYSYKGCYRFSEYNFMGLVDQHSGHCSLSAGRSDSQCSLQFNIRAPIDSQHSTCKLLWLDSEYTVDGDEWIPFTSDPKEFSLSSFTKEEKQLKIMNRTSLLSKWQGMLLKLTIECRSTRSLEKQCVLLKIAGTATTNDPTVSTTSSPTSPPTTSHLTTSHTSSYVSLMSSGHSTTDTSTTANNEQKNNSLGERDDEDSSVVIVIMVPVLVVLALLLAAIGATLLYRWRRRATQKQNETVPIHHVGSIASSSFDPADQELPNVYENPENIRSTTGEEYHYPYDEINETNQSRENSENIGEQNLTYDYATREETNFEPNSEIRPTNHHYDAVEIGPQNGVPRPIGEDEGEISEPSGEQPFYHTLEDNDGMRRNDERVYESVNEKEGGSEHFYNVLEGP